MVVVVGALVVAALVSWPGDDASSPEHCESIMKPKTAPIKTNQLHWGNTGLRRGACGGGGGGLVGGGDGGLIGGGGVPPRLWPHPAQNLSVDDTAAPHSVQNPSSSTMRQVLHPAA